MTNFKNHKSHLIKPGNITIITYQEDNNVDTIVRFIFDKELSTLVITGAYGSLTATNVNNMGDIHKFYNDYVPDSGYFLSKVTSASHQLQYYDEDLTKYYLLTEIFKIPKEHLANLNPISIEMDLEKFYPDQHEYLMSMFHDLMKCFDENSNTGWDFQHIPIYKLEELAESLNWDYDYMLHLLYDLPTKRSPYIQLYIDAYKDAYEQLFPNNKKE